MERFSNFPQTIDPVKSQTILEQFLELNNNVEKINQGYNELAPQVDINTNDISQLKTQVIESGTRVKINGQVVAEWSPDVLSSDVATNTEDIEQIRLAQSSDSLAIVALQSDNITNKQNISSLQSDNITNQQNISDLQGETSYLYQQEARSLKTPLTPPTTPNLIGVDTSNSQVLIPLLDLFPIGTIISKDVDISPASYIGGTWQKLPGGYALWTTTSGAGETINAGLPNITGTFRNDGIRGTASELISGAFSLVQGYESFGAYNPGGDLCVNDWSFDASKSNTIYGNSTTVQPPAYKVYAWRRIS